MFLRLSALGLALDPLTFDSLYFLAPRWAGATQADVMVPLRALLLTDRCAFIYAPTLGSARELYARIAEALHDEPGLAFPDIPPTEAEVRCMKF